VAKSVALLRGINLGRNKRVAMSDLRDLVTGLGYTDVSTHLQSGNVVFDAGATSPEAAAREIEAEIGRRLGMRVSVLVRTGDELAAVVKNNPMPERTAEPTKLLVAFLDQAPPPERMAEVDPAEFAPDEFQVAGREVYVWLPNGQQGAKLSNESWEKRLGVTATSRNWRTVTRLLELASG
jgi:uncharacterized protein (DUF1697 family)